MKVSTHREEIKFRPVKLEIVLETPEEVDALFTLVGYYGNISVEVSHSKQALVDVGFKLMTELINFREQPK